MTEKYNFDGILINLPGRPRNIQNFIKSIKRNNNEIKVTWINNNYTIIPYDDNPHYFQSDGSRYFPSFDELEPEKLFYIEPWDITEINYPYKWSFEKDIRNFDNFFPDYHLDTIKIIKDKVGSLYSIHSEVFSPWSQFLELLNYENALIAIMDNPGKVKACLSSLTKGAAKLAKLQAKEGVDAILISSAFAGAGLISKAQYLEFVLPYEKEIIREVKKEFDIPVYTHTCGSIGDRLELMLETGTNGIDTLDPPPLGTVELEEAKSILRKKAFIKGNIDPVNTLLYGTEDEILKDVGKRIKTGMLNGGYILSSACSIAPKTPLKNIKLLSSLVQKLGNY